MIDIMENKVLGPAVLKGEATLLRRQLKERFGALPNWALDEMSGATERQLLSWGKRVLTAKTLEPVFRKKR